MAAVSPRTVLEIVRRRWNVLESLSLEPSDKAELVSRVDVSRSTVNRAVRELEDAELLERVSGKFHLTVVGRLMVQLQRDVESTASSIAKARRILEPLNGTCSPAPCLFCDATVLDGDGGQMDPLDFIVRQVQEADRMRAVHGPRRVDVPATIRDLVLSGELDAELVFSEASLEWFQRFHVGDEAIDGDVDLAYVDDPFPYAVILTENADSTRVTLATFDESATLVGVVSNDAPEAVAWGRQHLEEVCKAATPVSSTT